MNRTLIKNIHLVRAIFKEKILENDDITITIESNTLAMKKNITASQLDSFLNTLDHLIGEYKEPRTPLTLSSPSGN